jgi:hypothetical protein
MPADFLKQLEAECRLMSDWLGHIHLWWVPFPIALLFVAFRMWQWVNGRI